MNKSTIFTNSRRRRNLMPPAMASVVVVHGWASSRLEMWLFCRRLRSLGYSVFNWGYQSVRRSIDDHASSLNSFVDTVAENSSREYLHLVGHSMGGIVIRKALQTGRPNRIGRVVMLAPPNRGSFVAGQLAPWLAWFSTTLSEISDKDDSYVNQLGDLRSQQVGIVAASRDRVIRESHVHLDGEVDFVRINSGHGIMPFKRQAVRSTHRFLMQGKF